MAVLTVSYVTVPSAMGMQEFSDTPSNGADKSCMTLNLPWTFFAQRPSGDITYARKTDYPLGSELLH